MALRRGDRFRPEADVLHSRRWPTQRSRTFRLSGASTILRPVQFLAERTMALNTSGSEVVVLLAIKTMIDSMVNHDLLLVGSGTEAEVRFKANAHGRLFNVLLVDLLSQIDKEAPVKKESYLQALKGVCDSPCFNLDDAVGELREATDIFRAWVSKEIVIENLWLPTISLGVPLRDQTSRHPENCWQRLQA